MKYCLTFLFLLVIFTGCTSDLPKDRMLYASFPKEETLHSKVIQLDSVYMRYPFRVHVSGDQAVVLDLHGTDVYCHLFHYPDFHYLSSFGRRGDSPEEMLSVETVKCIDGSFWTLDANKGELTRFEFVSDRDSLLRAEAISFDKDSILRALDFVAFNDTTFLIPDYSGEPILLGEPTREVFEEKWSDSFIERRSIERGASCLSTSLAQFYRL
jgi:hypothetical protein